MNTSSVNIPIHSFVDLITNSSSEIFIAANKGTIIAIKKLVNHLIKATTKVVIDDNGNEVQSISANDLFNFDITYPCYDENCNEVGLTRKEMSDKRKELSEIICNNSNKYTERQVESAKNWELYDVNDSANEYISSSMRVTVKDSTNKHAVEAAKILSSLSELFDINSTYQ